MMGFSKAVTLASLLALVGATSGQVEVQNAAGDQPVQPAEQPQTTPPAEPERDWLAELVNEDGSWKYTNRLEGANSNYLRSHAHHPVDWFAWGPEAFAAADERDKPIFLVVGAGASFWCQDMRRNVFSRPDVAELLNESFVNILVDREERPDVDELSLTYAEITRRPAGWPALVFLTNELKPFFITTNMPAENGDGIMGLKRLAELMSQGWNEDWDQINEASNKGAERIQQLLCDHLAITPRPALRRDLTDTAVMQMTMSFDATDGGWGRSTKFPDALRHPLLFDLTARTGHAQPQGMAMRTLKMMARGAICDQVGGGFFRYTVDDRWYIPDFEKSLPDQALIVDAYLRAEQITPNRDFRRVIHETLRFVDEELTGPNGEFYSAIHSDFNGAEGAWYRANEADLRAVLDPEDAEVFFSSHAMSQTRDGKVPSDGHGSVIHRIAGFDEFVERSGVSEDEILDITDRCLQTFLELRRAKGTPGRSENVVAAWNGLMIGALARAGQVLDTPEYIARAKRAARFVLNNMRGDDGRLQRTWLADGIDQRWHVPGFLEDYAGMTRGLIALHQVTGEQHWLDSAVELLNLATGEFADSEAGAFFSSTDARFPVRSKSPADKSVPGPNSMIAHTLIDLYEITGEERYLDRAQALLEVFSKALGEAAIGYVHLLHAMERYYVHRPPAETPQIGDDGSEIPAPVDDELVQVEASLSADTIVPGGVFRILLRMNIAEGWRVTGNPPGRDGVTPTGLTLRSRLPIELLHVEYPIGVEQPARFNDPGIRYYDGTEVFIATARLGEDAEPGKTGRIFVVTQYETWNEEVRNPPIDQGAIVELKVAGEAPPKPVQEPEGEAVGQ